MAGRRLLRLLLRHEAHGVVAAAAAHGGTLTVRSVLGRGSDFTVRFPLEHAD